VTQEIFAPRHEPLSQLGQYEPASTSVEELRIEFFLETSDALGERRLGEVERISGR
jgi:hypothetical protein